MKLKSLITACFFFAALSISRAAPPQVVPNYPLRQIKEIASQPGSPIQYDSRMNEFHLKAPEKQPDGAVQLISWRMRFCPFTGERLPESRRKLFFTEPSPEEVKKFSQLLKGLSTLDEFRQVLGEPHFVSPDEKTLHFSAKAETLIVIAKQNSEGNVEFAFAGRELKTPREPSKAESDRVAPGATKINGQ